ncbi:MAG: hypothetical protein V1736_07165 [Pseudomonadota bacterium]
MQEAKQEQEQGQVREFQDWEYVPDTDAAKILACAVQTLRNDRHLGRGVAYVKRNRTIRYLVRDLRQHMEAHKIHPEGR